MITITHCTDTQALIAEIKEKYPELESDGQFLVNKKPHSVKNGNETLNRIMISDEDYEKISQLKNITCLGDYDEVFNDTDKLNIYNRVYVRQYEYIDEEGNTQTGLKPEEFSRFSGEEYYEL